MTRKIKIRREPDGWHVVRPAFGFGSPTTTVYPTGAAALGSLTAQGLASNAALIERGASQSRFWHWRWSTAPGWIEAR